MVLLANKQPNPLDGLPAEQYEELRRRAFYFYKAHYEHEARLSFEDLFHDSLLRILDGSRNWTPGKVSFSGFLYGTMRSTAYHQLKKMNQTSIQSIDDECQVVTAQIETDFISNLVWDQILDWVGDNSALRRVVECRRADSKAKLSDVVALMPDVAKEDAQRAWRQLREIIKRESETGGLL